MIIDLLLMWCACAVLAAGIWVAYFQRCWPSLAQENYRKDLTQALVRGFACGPITLMVVFIMSDFAKYGWTLRRAKVPS